MEFVEQSWKFLSVTVPYNGTDESLSKATIRDTIKLIELAGRTCYKSEDRITDDSAEKFVKFVVERGHHSVIEHVFIGVKIITDRGVTHEIVRHRLASYSQESTRYCNYGKLGIRFILPVDFDLDDRDMAVLKVIEEHYNKCLADGRSPQQARYFLPNGLKTEIVMSCNVREWLHFFKLRSDLAAHPQMRALAKDMLMTFAANLPVIFMDLAKGLK